MRSHITWREKLKSSIMMSRGSNYNIDLGICIYVTWAFFGLLKIVLWSPSTISVELKPCHYDGLGPKRMLAI